MENKLLGIHYGKSYYGEAGYREMIKNILNDGIIHEDRTGIGRKKLISQKLIYNLQESFPIHSTRPCPFRFAFHEIQAFLSGRSDIHNILSRKGINFWKGNTTRKFLDSVGLHYLEEGNMGMAYGVQMRNFGGQFNVKTQQVIPNSGIDQMKYLFENLKTQPYDSRQIFTMWNPSQLKQMALPPCWHTGQFTVIDHNNDKHLNLSMIARSSDAIFGLPFNILGYSYLCNAFAQGLGYKRGFLTCELIDTHIYTNQLDYARELISRKYSTMKCNFSIRRKIKDFEDIASLEYEDLEISIPEGFVNRTPFNTKKPAMAV